MTGTVVAGAAVAFAQNTDIPSALSVVLPKSPGKDRHDMCQNYYSSAAFPGSRHTANAVGFHQRLRVSVTRTQGVTFVALSATLSIYPNSRPYA